MNIKFNAAIFIFTIIVLAAISCRREPDLTGLPEVSFKNNISPILSSNCTFSGCHSESGGKFPLITYDQVMNQVEPGRAHKSGLYKSLVNEAEENMPPDNYPQLTNDELKYIYVWIEQGAKNN